MTPQEIAEYALFLLEKTPGRETVLQLVMAPGDERDAVLTGLIHGLGGGHVIAPARNPAAPFVFEAALGLLEQSPVLALEGARAIRERGINPEAIRQETLVRQGRLVLVGDNREELEEFRLELNPRSIVQFEVTTGELRVAPAADRARGYLRIPRSGGRPEFVAIDRDLGSRVADLAGRIVDDALNSGDA